MTQYVSKNAWTLLIWAAIFGTGFLTSKLLESGPVFIGREKEAFTTITDPKPKSQTSIKCEVREGDLYAQTESATTNRLKVLAWANKNNTGSIYCSVLDTLKENDRFSILFSLSPESKQRIKDALKKTAEEIGSIRSAKAVIYPGEESNTLTITLPETTDGAALYDNLLSVIKSELGPERFELFNEIGGHRFETEFGYYGLSTITYNVTKSESWENHDEYKIVRVEKFGIQTIQSTSNLIETSMTSDKDFIYPLILKHLPPRFHYP